MTIDMNDPSNLAIYTRLLLLHHDHAQNHLEFEGNSPRERLSIQSMADSLGLEFEYRNVTQTSRVTRPILQSNIDARELYPGRGRHLSLEQYNILESHALVQHVSPNTLRRQASAESVSSVQSVGGAPRPTWRFCSHCNACYQTCERMLEM
jgi:hypothetical protein